MDAVVVGTRTGRAGDVNWEMTCKALLAKRS